MDIVVVYFAVKSPAADSQQPGGLGFVPAAFFQGLENLVPTGILC